MVLNLKGAVRQRADAIIRHLDGPNPVVAEIGVSQGRLSRLLRDRTPFLYLIDSWRAADSKEYLDTRDGHALMPQREHEANYKLAKQVDANITRKDSVEAASDFADGMFDLVFIDADHSYEGCKRDILAWLPKVKKDGWLSGHDYGDPQFGVTDAVNEVFGQVELDENLTWFYRK